jgi:predicted esterase
MLIPDFVGPLEERLSDLENAVAGEKNLTLIGSSYGGLMAAIHALENEARVAGVFLLAPALNFPEFEPYRGRKTGIPARLYIGRRDEVCPPGKVIPIAVEIFSNLTVHESEDDHLLRTTFPAISWHDLLPD